MTYMKISKMMKVNKILICSILVCMSLNMQAQCLTMEQRFQKLQGVVSVEQIAGGQFFEKYVLFFKQYVDYNDTTRGTFLQRVIVGHLNTDSLVVLHTHGYNAADHKKRIAVRDELAKLLNANNVFIEHRYFGESWPNDTNWNYLTTQNAATDQHRIITELKKIYTNKWVSTGGSKDGITSTLLSMYYPKDIAVAVPYVAPFCLTTEDMRGVSFMQKCGTPEKRERIRRFQLEALERRDSLQPRLKHYADSLKMVFGSPFDMIYDFCILDYDFGFWMRGVKETEIPAADASNDVYYEHLLKYANPDLFDHKSAHRSYYVQAQKELGCYGYDYEPFRHLLCQNTLNCKDIMKALYLPKGDWDFTYSDSTRSKVMNFLDTTSCKLLYIYGETDAWTAFRIPQHRDNIRQYTLPDGCHYSKIKQFNDSTYTEIMSYIKNWLKDK